MENAKEGEYAQSVGHNLDGARTTIMDKRMQEGNGSGTSLERRKRSRSIEGNDLPSFSRRVVVTVLLTLGLLALALIAWRGIHVLLEAFAGVLFGVFLSALAQWLHQRTRLSYG